MRVGSLTIEKTGRMRSENGLRAAIRVHPSGWVRGVQGPKETGGRPLGRGKLVTTPHLFARMGPVMQATDGSGQGWDRRKTVPNW